MNPHAYRDLLSTPMRISLSSSFRGMIVSNAELKSTNNTLVLLYAGGLKMLQNAVQADLDLDLLASYEN